MKTITLTTHAVRVLSVLDGKRGDRKNTKYHIDNSMTAIEIVALAKITSQNVYHIIAELEDAKLIVRHVTGPKAHRFASIYRPGVLIHQLPAHGEERDVKCTQCGETFRARVSTASYCPSCRRERQYTHKEKTMRNGSAKSRRLNRPFTTSQSPQNATKSPITLRKTRYSRLS